MEYCSITVIYSLQRLEMGKKLDPRLRGNDCVAQKLIPSGIRPDGTINKAPALEVFGKEGQQRLIRNKNLL